MSERAIRTSDTIANIAGALLAAKSEFPVITKDRTANIPTSGGKQYSYSYADLGAVIDGTKQALANNGLVVIQPLGAGESGGAVVTLLMHTSGEWIESTFPVTIAAKAQETGSAITYTRRYALVALLGIATEDDDDGAAASKPKKAKESALPPAADLPVLDIAKNLRVELGKTAKDEGLEAVAGRLIVEWFGDGKTSKDLDPTQLRTARKQLEVYGANLRTAASLGEVLNLNESDLLLIAAEGAEDAEAALLDLTSTTLADLVINLKHRATEKEAPDA